MKQTDLISNANGLIRFIEQCPTAYQTVDTIKETLLGQGYSELKEHEEWHVREGGCYFVTRNGSSILAFRIPEKVKEIKGYQIMATHGDSPTFKLKPLFEKKADGGCVQWNVEKYGGMICSS